MRYRITTLSAGLGAAALALSGAALAQSDAPRLRGQVQSGYVQLAQVQLAQVRKRKKRAAPRRAPTRITVQPLQRYRLDSTPYPRTDNLGFPGRNAVRQCEAWLQPEHRPAGTVLVPYRRCWWERG